MLGAHEVGMLRALAERAITPDVILGTSIGAVNGAFFAADPTPARRRAPDRAVVGDELGRDVGGAHVSPASPRSPGPDPSAVASTEVRERLVEALPVERVEQLIIPFQCVAASIERAAEHWFDSGPLAEVVLASCSVPGILPPVRIGDEHFIDGGSSTRFRSAGPWRSARRRSTCSRLAGSSKPLKPPRWPWEVGLVAFEVARRHRFAHDLASLPDGVNCTCCPPAAPPRRPTTTCPPSSGSAVRPARCPSRLTRPTRPRCSTWRTP